MMNETKKEYISSYFAVVVERYEFMIEKVSVAHGIEDETERFVRT